MPRAFEGLRKGQPSPHNCACTIALLLNVATQPQMTPAQAQSQAAHLQTDALTSTLIAALHGLTTACKLTQLCSAAAGLIMSAGSRHACE